MKFFCSRCQTRYSIADERVRGKILKIRCKNCSEIITVKEDGPAPAKAAASPQAARAPAAAKAPAAQPSSGPNGSGGSALSSAFAKAMTGPEPDPGSSGSAPASIDGDWYVAEGGVQSGPFNLGRAREWVAARPASAELFCWTDGFDEWQLVARVAQFRAVQGTAAPPPRPAEPPGPLFADLPSGPELEIGEVSRVVRLPIMPPRQRTGETAAPLPGLGAEAQSRVGRGTGSTPSIPVRSGLFVPPTAIGMSRKHSRGFWILLFGGGASVIAFAALLIIMAMGSEDEGPGLVRSKMARGDLGYTLGQVEGRGSQGEATPADEPTTGSSSAGQTRVVRRPATTTPTRTPTGTSGGSDEVTIGTGGDEAVELSPEQVELKYRQSTALINRCYERALKRDPFLDVRRADVTVSIDMNGRTRASIPGIANQVLRECLEATIGGWRFPKPKEPLNTRLTMVFK